MNIKPRFILTYLFCRFVVPRLKYMRGYKMVSKPAFQWQGKKVCRASTVVLYEHRDGRKARLIIELL